MNCKISTTLLAATVLVLAPACLLSAPAAEPVQLKITGDWQVEVVTPKATVAVPKPAIVNVKAEKYDRLPLFNPAAPGWMRGAVLRGLLVQECSATGLLIPESVEVAGAGHDSPRYERGKDFDFDSLWGTLGRMSQGRIGADDAVAITYRHGLLRLDSIVLRPDGQVALRPGEPHAAAPLSPPLANGEQRLANVWIPGPIQRLAAENLFPILETAYPEPPKPSPSPAERLFPRRWASSGRASR